eukprot:10755270-Alexandrium_andersonii.AAC.1
MSASLVGSEMCIRDSRGVADFVRRGVTVKRLVRSLLGKLSFVAGLVPACLLYTSDAADDM